MNPRMTAMHSLRLLLILLCAVAAPSAALDLATGEEFNGPYPSWRNLKTAYGAVGDGTTDDTAAIQAALNDLKNTISNPWSVLYVPAGRYRITAPLTTVRSAHNDYLGASIIGEDPATTVLAWHGPADAAMLRWDAWYDKVSRLTFDGRGIAGTGIQRAGGFATSSELSDLQLQDLRGSGIDLGHGEANGIAEQAVLRCRFLRCGTGLDCWNYNTLDIYVWNCFFADCGTGLLNATGAFHAYGNRFLRSTVADLRSTTNMLCSVVGNVSAGSAAFISGFQAGLHLQGNRIYDCTGIALDLGACEPVLMLDNLIRDADGGVAALISGGTATLVGNTFAGPELWPVRTPERPFNHGEGAGTVIGHPIDAAIDGDPATWSVQGLWSTSVGLDWNAPYGTSPIATSWAITAAPEQPRPRDVRLEASNDWGNTWTVLATQNGLTFTPGQRRSFAIASPAPYALYRLRVLANSAGEAPGDGGWVGMSEFELRDAADANLVALPGSHLTGCDEAWGQFSDIERTVAAAAAHPTPTLEPWAFAPRVARTVIEVGAPTSAAVQTAIDQAAALPAGQRRVVHLPKGSYAVSGTITVPAGLDVVLVGDGGAEHGTRLGGNAGAGPVLRLLGPSRATVRDLTLGGGADSGDALSIENADQDGGRVYGCQVGATGTAPGQHHCRIAFDIDGVERSDVTMAAFGFSRFMRGVRVTGGTVLAGGGSAPGQVSFLTGATSHGCRAYETRSGGRLIATGIWYEGDWAYEAPLVDLGADCSGALTIVSQLMSARLESMPLMRTSGFAGSLNVLASSLDHRASTHLDFTGDGHATRVLGIGNVFPMYEDPQAATKTIAQLWNDTTSPAGQAAHIGSGFPPCSGRTIGAMPGRDFLLAQLAQLRALRVEPATDRAPGVTDVKLIRVQVSAGDASTAIAIRGDPAAAADVLTVSAGADILLARPAATTLHGSITAVHPLSSIAWTQVSGPSTATWTGGHTADATVDALVDGTYVFRLAVADDHGNARSDDVIVSIGGSAGGAAGGGSDSGGGGGCGLGGLLGLLTACALARGGVLRSFRAGRRQAV